MPHNTAYARLRLDRVMLEWTAKREELEEIYRTSTGYYRSKKKALSPSEKALLAVMAGFQTDGPYKPLSLPSEQTLPSKPNVGGPGLTILKSNYPMQQPKFILASRSTAPPAIPEEISRSVQQITAPPTPNEVSISEPGHKRPEPNSIVFNRTQLAVDAALAPMTPEELAIYKQHTRATRMASKESRMEQEKKKDAKRAERIGLKMINLGLTRPLEKKESRSGPPPTPDAGKRENRPTTSPILNIQRNGNQPSAPLTPTEITIQNPPVPSPTTPYEIANLKQGLQEKRAPKRKLQRETKGEQVDKERERIKARILLRRFPPLPEHGAEETEMIKARIISGRFSPLAKENIENTPYALALPIRPGQQKMISSEKPSLPDQKKPAPAPTPQV